MAFTGLTSREAVPSAADLVPGTRVVASSQYADLLVQREKSWLSSLAPWTREGPYAELVRDAYLDIFALSEELPAPVAGWSTHWRYVWPRDTAHIAVAFSAAGDSARAHRSLDFLARLPRTSRGWFEARYTLDGRGAPDDRAPQFDGLGWAAWALGWIHEHSDNQEQFRSRYSVFAAELADSLVRNVEATDGQVPVSSDYWEIRERTITLGTAAPTLAGLQWLIPFLEASGDTDRAARCTAAARSVDAYILDVFGKRGYPRHADGYTLDSAVAFLLPPYTRDISNRDGVIAAMRRAETTMLQPAGGLSPGEDWHEDRVSWTPKTAVFSLANATLGTADGTIAGQRGLTWLESHRTDAGTFPEKVLADGNPSAVAPLAWTAACVALSAHALRVRRPAGAGPGTVGT